MNLAYVQKNWIDSHENQEKKPKWNSRGRHQPKPCEIAKEIKDNRKKWMKLNNEVIPIVKK
jgi:hypothetical protein